MAKKEPDFEKVVNCKKCDRKFTAQAQYEYSENGDDKFDGYGEICPWCICKIDPKLVDVVKLYVDGLLTDKEFTEKLK